MIQRFDSKERFVIQLKEGIGLFTGAGFSVEAVDTNNEKLPIGLALLNELKAKFPQISTFPDLAGASTFLEKTCKEEFYAYLTARFNVLNYSALYDVLPKLNITDIFTVNIDNLIYRIYAASDLKYINTTNIEGTPCGNGMAVNYSPLHGCVNYPEKGFIFSKIKIASAYTDQHDDWISLRYFIGRKSILFWGWSFEDSDVTAALYSGKNVLDYNDYKWILLRNPKDFEIDFYTALGFKIIIGDTESMLTELATIQSELAKDTESTETGMSLPEYSLPIDATMAHHPLSSFFEGDAPKWSQINSGDIIKTHYYSIIGDLIDQGKNLLVIGIPVSGKTTLMMQLMYGYSTSKTKHFLTAPSLNETRLYLKKTASMHSKILLFVDDCFRDYRSVVELLKAPNVQLVFFDRDYYYESQAYRVRSFASNFEIVDITEINDLDSRKLIDSIPSGLKKTKTTINIEDKTIYSVLSKNMRKKKFERRFKDMLGDLYRTNPVATELFIMICYVHSCGVPVSYDMIHSYLSDRTRDYNKIRQYIREIGKIIVECADDSFNFLNINLEEQDYYQSRSRYFAERIMKNLPYDSDILKRVLEVFVSNVPPFLICRFDVFKRHGFDAEFASRAFGNIEDGARYYERCTSIDNTEYIYQQAALYFDKKKQYTLAFQWIDRAKNSSSFNRFSIDNTHAIIQFHANIEAQDDASETVRKLLEDSLNTLRYCYDHDRRKNIHVISFAELSIKFFDRYGLKNAQDYLQSAYEWLKREDQSGVYGYRMRSQMRTLQFQIQDILARTF